MLYFFCIRYRLFLVLLVLLCCCSVRPAQAEATDITVMKAVYMYNFIRFSQWMDDPAAKQKVRVSVYASEVFVNRLKEISEKSRYLPTMSVRWCSNMACANDAHVIYFHGVEETRLNALLQRFADQPVLTVSDQVGFVQQGGMIQLVEENGRLLFDINLQAIRQSGLYLSADILGMARSVVSK